MRPIAAEVCDCRQTHGLGVMVARPLLEGAVRGAGFARPAANRLDFRPEQRHTAAMRKRVHIALAVLLVAGVGVTAWLVLRPKEPVYAGTPLSVWLKSFDMGISKEEAGVAADAVRHMGTNALPMLLKVINSKDRNWRWESLLAWIDGIQTTWKHRLQWWLLGRRQGLP